MQIHQIVSLMFAIAGSQSVVAIPPPQVSRDARPSYYQGQFHDHSHTAGLSHAHPHRHVPPPGSQGLNIQSMGWEDYQQRTRAQSPPRRPTSNYGKRLVIEEVDDEPDSPVFGRHANHRPSPPRSAGHASHGHPNLAGSDYAHPPGFQGLNTQSMGWDAYKQRTGARSPPRSTRYANGFDIVELN